MFSPDLLRPQELLARGSHGLVKARDPRLPVASPDVRGCARDGGFAVPAPTSCALPSHLAPATLPATAYVPPPAWAVPPLSCGPTTVRTATCPSLVPRSFDSALTHCVWWLIARNSWKSRLDRLWDLVFPPTQDTSSSPGRRFPPAVASQPSLVNVNGRPTIHRGVCRSAAVVHEPTTVARLSAAAFLLKCGGRQCCVTQPRCQYNAPVCTDAARNRLCLLYCVAGCVCTGSVLGPL